MAIKSQSYMIQLSSSQTAQKAADEHKYIIHDCTLDTQSYVQSIALLNIYINMINAYNEQRALTKNNISTKTTVMSGEFSNWHAC